MERAETKPGLAIDGGSPVIDSPLSAWPRFEKDEIEAVEKVLKSGRVNYWTGSEVKKFEAAFAARCGARHAIALANGTVALELALEALEVGPGDEVIVTPRSFFASTSCVVARGATPVFADVDRLSGNLEANGIAACISPRTKAVIVVHLAGWPCDLDPICAEAKKHGYAVIEDCAQAHGATYRGRPVGGIGDFGSFSFCQDKIMTTGGEGGMLVTNNEDLWRRAWSYKDHGKDYDAVHAEYDNAGFRWLHNDFGTNWRLTEMQAAIGLCQLEKLSGWLQRRQANAAILSGCLGDYEAVRPPGPPDNVTHAWYKFYTFVNDRLLKADYDRDWLREALRAEGVAVIDGTCSEIYKEAAFDRYPDMRPGQSLPVAQELGRSSLMFQIDHTQGEAEMALMCQAIRKVLDFAQA